MLHNYNAMLVHNNAILKEGEIIYLLSVFCLSFTDPELELYM